MYRTFVLTVSLLCVVIFSGYAQQKTSDTIVLYDKSIMKGIPYQIIPLKESNSYSISNLKVDVNGKVTLDVNKKVKEECAVVLFFRAEKQFLIVNLDSEREMTFHSSGAVLFGVSSQAGHRVSASADKGSISFSVQKQVWNRYDMTGVQEDLYAFVVKGQVYSNTVMPGNQNDETAYQTSSNVLKIKFAFK